MPEIGLDALWSESFAWAWLHSWWQSGLVACLYAGAARVWPAARARYALGCVGLLMVLVLPAATFFRHSARSASAANNLSAFNQLPPLEQIVDTNDLAPRDAANTRGATAVTAVRVNKTDSLRQRAEERFAALSPYLALLWLVGVMFLTLRFAGGWWTVRRVCRRAEPVAEYWQHRLELLARRVQLSQTARLCESALVKVPTAVGWLRPVILLPVGALAGLPPQQLEALLAHELAHLRRHDFLVNLCQIAVETLLFYHPAVWWLSREIRREREHLCDDIAVQVTGDPVLYAHALTNLELYRRQADWTSVALAANGGNLMQRIQRLIQPQPTQRAIFGGVWLAILLAGVIFGANTLASRPKDKTPVKRKIALGFVALPATTQVGDALEPTRILLEHLKREKVPATGFVQGAKAEGPERLEMLRQWRDAGLELGIGNYSHKSLYNTPYEEYVANVEAADKLVRPLLEEKGLALRYFSYPFLNTGPDAATKERFAEYALQHNYRVAKFTMDNDDWTFGKTYDEAAAENYTGVMTGITAEYPAYMGRVLDFYEGYSQKLFGREISQVLLITTSRFTAQNFPVLLQMLRERGYEVVTMEEAMSDEAYNSPDNYTGQTGISWLQRWNITRGGNWQTEPRAAGPLENIRFHQGQGNLKTAPPPPPPPPPPPAELRRKAPRPPVPARRAEPPRPAQPGFPVEVPIAPAPPVPAPAEGETYPRQAAPLRELSYPQEVEVPLPATFPRSPRSYPRVPAVETPAPAVSAPRNTESAPRVPAVTPQPAKPVTLPRKPAPPPPPARPEN